MAQPGDPLARAAIPAAVLYGAGPARTRHHRPQRGTHVLHADVAGTDRRGGLRRRQGLRAGRRAGGKPLRPLPAEPRDRRLHRHVRRKGARPYTGRRGGRRGAGHALLGCDPGLRLDRKRLQQHLGGQGRSQPHPPVYRLHRRGDDRAGAVGRCQCRWQIRPADAGLRRQLVFHPALAPGVDGHHLGHVHHPVYHHPQYEGQIQERPDGGHRRRHAFPAFPVGIPLHPAVDDLLQCHLRQFRSAAAVAHLAPDLVADPAVRRRIVVRLPEHRPFRRRARIAAHQLRPAAQDPAGRDAHGRAALPRPRRRPPRPPATGPTGSSPPPPQPQPSFSSSGRPVNCSPGPRATASAK